MLRKLFKFHGGVKPETHKDSSTTQAIAKAPLPRPAQGTAASKHRRHAPSAGQGRRKVLKGQRIGGADGNVSSAVHAPTSGTVIAVEPVLMAHASGLSTLSVMIEFDGEDRWIERHPIDLRATPADEIRDYLRDQGVVGLAVPYFQAISSPRPVATKPTRT